MPNSETNPERRLFLNMLLSRRDFLRNGLIATAAAARMLIPPIKGNKDNQPQIVPVNYQPGRGAQSFTWVPVPISKEGEESTSFNEGGAMDDYDRGDITLNGGNSLAARNGRYTRLVLREYFDELLESGELNPEWAGHCYGASSASWECPIIDGPINLFGVEIPAIHRMQLATWYYSTMRYDEWLEINDDVIAEIEDVHFADGEGIGVNHTPVLNQEWWGTLIEVKQKGREWILRDFRKLSPEDNVGRDGILTIDPHELTSARIFHYDGPHPGKENDYNYFDRRILGVIIGTHQLVA